MTRLPPRPGEWIDRTAPVSFRFEGREYQGYAGDVATSALWAAGVRMVGRSFKYHRPRGTLSLSGYDTAAMFDDDDRTNLRGDVLPIHNGLELRSVNTWGGLAHDWLRFAQWGARLMPVGFYYKAFHTPRRLFPFYERQLRRIAGLGRIHVDSSVQPTPKDYAFCELLVIGTGLAGLAGALTAANCGVQVLLVDEQPRPGGSQLWQLAQDAEARSRRDKLLAEVTAHTNIQIRCGTQVAGCYADRWIALVDQQRLTKLRAGAVLVASGVFEQPAVFQNNDLPGVLLGSAAQRLLHLYAVQPCHKCVILAGNSEAYAVALDLTAAGVDVACIAELRSEGETSELAARVEAEGIPVYLQHTVSQAIAQRGGTGVKGAMVCPLDELGHPDLAAARRLDCDGVVVSVGWTPAGAPLYQLGGRFSYSSGAQQFVPKTLPAGLFAAGRINGQFTWDGRLADGQRAGLAAAAFLGKSHELAAPELEPIGQPHSHDYPIFAHPAKKNFVDLDEDLHLADFANAHQEGYDNIELLKRYTTVGMGPSQGKLANMNAIRILARLNGDSINETGTTTSRPFHHPVPLGHLAGRRFHPSRRTPMHHWHLQAGAEMVHAGLWRRPEFYHLANKKRADLILEEAINVRESVGLIDLGTLGKIQVSGRDAVAFLERIYTLRFTKQKVGAIRYGLACDETGAILDDGVVARLDENRFYVTATTGGAAAFFREMQRWALIWRMEVDLFNCTGQLTALNITGPKAREVLGPWTDVDLSEEAFGLGKVREGHVGGAPAILMRVAFVGETGYEIHLPASYGLSLWTRLIEAGQTAGLRPFGIEAQRLLRLEMGHPIVTIDTDALTNPYEANLDWAVKEDKEFFVGQRSLSILKGQTLARRLAGFEIDPDYQGPLPQECHLIIDQDQIAGRVTSIAHKSTIGKKIGLAFIRPELTDIGTPLTIRVDHGKLVNATVAKLPFYSPG